MIVECNNCHAKYNVDESKIPDTGIKVKCHKCQSIIFIQKAKSIPEPAPTPEPVAAPTPPPEAPSEPAYQVPSTEATESSQAVRDPGEVDLDSTAPEPEIPVPEPPEPVEPETAPSPPQAPGAPRWPGRGRSSLSN